MTFDDTKERQPELKETGDQIKPESGESVDEDQGSSNESLPDLGSRFKVSALIGQGGMGSVYKALDNELNTTVAIKVLKKELVSDKAAIKRFEQEASSLSELNHENLVSVYGSGQTDNGTPYLVMDYLEGEDLASILKRESSLTPERAIELLKQICAGLAHAHKNGIVHRDIKPSNILVTSQEGSTSETVKILDFGIARIVESTIGNTTNLTQTGDVFGTPTYMSPEQCDGKAVDHRSDIYSLGCMLYEMLLGKPPFQGATPIQVAVKHINDEPEKFPKEFTKSKLNKGIANLVMGTLIKEPELRYQSMEELINDIDAATQSKRVSRHVLKEKEVRPKWLVNAAAFSLIFIIQGLVMISLFQNPEYLMSAYGSLANEESYAASRNTLFGIYCVCNFFALLFWPGMLYCDLKMLKAVDFKTKHFWMFAESIFGNITIFSGFLLFMIPTLLDVTGAFTGMVAAILVVIYIFGVLNTLFASILASIYSNKWMAAQNAKFTMNRVMHQGGFLPIIFVCILASMFPLFPKQMSYVPYGVANFASLAAPDFSDHLLDWSISLDPKNVMAHELKSEISLKADKLDSALHSINESIKQNPKSDLLFYHRAKIYVELEKPELAIIDLDNAIKLAPKESRNFWLKARIFENSKQYEKAIDVYSRAIKVNPGDTSNYLKRGLLYAATKNYDRAIDDMEKSLIGDGSYSSVRSYLRLGIIYDLKGDKAQSLNYFRKVIEKKNYAMDLSKAYAYKMLGDTKNYKAHLAKRKSFDNAEKNWKTEILQGIDLPMNLNLDDASK